MRSAFTASPLVTLLNSLSASQSANMHQTHKDEDLVHSCISPVSACFYLCMLLAAAHVCIAWTCCGATACIFLSANLQACWHRVCFSPLLTCRGLGCSGTLLRRKNQMQQSAPITDVYACSTKACLLGLTRTSVHDYSSQILGTFHD